MDEVIPINELADLRRTRYRQTKENFVRSEDDALDFINEMGFVWLIDPSEADLPSVHLASPSPYKPSGHRYVQNAASWWDLKQTLPGRKACYYSKVLRGRGTFISWDCFPLFYAVYATGNDYRHDYREGILSRDEKRVLDLVGGAPEISTHELRRKFGTPGKDTTRAMDRALQNLQETFRITVAGGSLEGWSLHNWALVEDWVPAECLERARQLDPSTAKRELTLRYVRMAIAASVGDIAWVFRWKRREVAPLVDDLVRESRLREVEVPDLPGILFSTGD